MLREIYVGLRTTEGQAVEREYLIEIPSMYRGRREIPVHMCFVNDRNHRLISVI